MSEYEEEILFNIIVVDHPTSFVQTNFLIFLNSLAFCHEKLCYFCSGIPELC